MNSAKKKKIFWGLFVIIIFITATYANSQNSNNLEEPDDSIVESSNATTILWVREIVAGAGFDEYNPLSNEEDLNEAERRYVLVINIKNASSVGSSDFYIYDDKGYQIPIIKLDSHFQRDDAEYGDNEEIWFEGKPNTKYKLVFNGYNHDYKQVEYSTEFKTSSRKPDLKKVLKETKNELNQYLQVDIKNELKEELEQSLNNIWSNMAPYYTPSEKEMQEIADAYWETYIKDLKILNLRLAGADTSTFSFELSYQLESPDMDDLNKRIDDRETELKKEVGNDYKRMFKTITKELPAIIRNTTQKNDTEEINEKISIEREVFEKRDNDSSEYYSQPDFSRTFSTLINPLKELYP